MADILFGMVAGLLIAIVIFVSVYVIWEIMGKGRDDESDDRDEKFRDL